MLSWVFTTRFTPSYFLEMGLRVVFPYKPQRHQLYATNNGCSLSIRLRPFWYVQLIVSIGVEDIVVVATLFSSREVFSPIRIYLIGGRLCGADAAPTQRMTLPTVVFVPS